MDDQLSPHESALRKLPLPYSLALRLRDAGVAPEVVSEYVGVDEAALRSTTAPHLVHVSTAYVAGERTGRARGGLPCA